MREDIEHKVESDSADFKQGVEAGLHSAEDTDKPPLFISDHSENKKGDLQDEKDETEE
jgi:hypothetical protein